MLYCHIPDLQAQLPNSCQYPGSNCASHVQHHNNHEMLYCFVSLLTVSLVSWRDLILSQRKEYSPRRNYLWFQTQYWFPEGNFLFPVELFCSPKGIHTNNICSPKGVHCFPKEIFELPDPEHGTFCNAVLHKSLGHHGCLSHTSALPGKLSFWKLCSHL